MDNFITVNAQEVTEISKSPLRRDCIELILKADKALARPNEATFPTKETTLLLHKDAYKYLGLAVGDIIKINLEIVDVD